jgi:hypothetical protein
MSDFVPVLGSPLEFRERQDRYSELLELLNS